MAVGTRTAPQSHFQRPAGYEYSWVRRVDTAGRPDDHGRNSRWLRSLRGETSVAGSGAEKEQEEEEDVEQDWGRKLSRTGDS